MTDDELNRQQAASDGVTPEVEAMLKELASAALRIGMISGASDERDGKGEPWDSRVFMAADARLTEAHKGLVAEVRRLREALAWYAAADHWTWRKQGCFMESDAEREKGARARAALEGGAS